MRLKFSACMLGLLVVGVVPFAEAAPQGPRAAARPPLASGQRVDDCVWQATDTSAWVDLNQTFGTPTVAHVNDYGSQCLTIKSGAWWSAPIGFYVAKTWEHVPAGYNYLPTPLEELIADTAKVRLIIDEGARQQFTLEWTNIQDSYVGDWNTFYAGTPDDQPTWLLVNMGTIGAIRPLSVGVHTLRRVWVVSRLSCDGTSDDPNSCAPPGEYDYGTFSFTVVPR